MNATLRTSGAPTPTTASRNPLAALERFWRTHPGASAGTSTVFAAGFAGLGLHGGGPTTTTLAYVGMASAAVLAGVEIRRARVSAGHGGVR